MRYYSEIEQRNLEERRKVRLLLTGDARRLMEILGRHSPEALESCRNSFKQKVHIEGWAYDTIHQTVYALFPGRETGEMIDLLAQMFDLVKEDVEGQRRLAERRAERFACTDDVKELMETLKSAAPEQWRSYRATVDQEGILDADTYNKILQKLFALFPERRTTREICDVLERMLEMTREDLGKGDWGADRKG